MGSFTVVDEHVDTIVPIRVYAPDDLARVGIVWSHGGGYFAGDLDMPEADAVGRALAARGIAVVSVDYRLARMPDHFAARFADRARSHGDVVHPVPAHDIEAAFDWAQRSALLADPDLWSIGGASAGAGLSAGVAMRLRDRARSPVGLVLVYPLLHAALPAPSPELQSLLIRGAQVFTPQDVDAMTRALLGNLGDPTQPYAFAGEHDPAGLPPTLIINAEVDSLRASGEAFGSSLRHARIATDVMTEPGSEHGYLNEPSDPASARTIDWIAKWLSQVGSRREHRTQREANSKEMGCY